MSDPRRLVLRVLIVQTIAMVLLIASVWLSSYQGRVNVVESQRAACERGKLDRRANARGWSIARARATSQGQLGFAAAYSSLARDLEERAAIDCHKAFPNPHVLEFTELR